MKKELEKIGCEICGKMVHVIEAHLREEHEGFDVEEYAASFPDAPLYSEAAQKRIDEARGFASMAKIDLGVQEAFGVEIGEMMETVRAFASPRKTTPEIDPHYVFEPKNLAICLYAIQKGKQQVLLTGPTGAGKSSVIEQVASRMNWGFYRINLDSDITRADLIGQWILKGEKMEFQYGLLPRAMAEGAILCLDEWDSVNPGVGMLLQPVLEGKPLVITETAETIYPAPDFRVFATSNTIGQGDTTGLYHGTQPQNFAQLDRFSMVGVVDYPSHEAEKKILALKAGIGEEDVANGMLEVARLVREAFVQGQSMATMSTRTVVNVAQKLVDFGSVSFAYEVAFINKLNPDDQQFAKEIIQRVYGSAA